MTDAARTRPASAAPALAEWVLCVQQDQGGRMPPDALFDSHRCSADLPASRRGRLQAVDDRAQLSEDTQRKPWIAG